MTNLPLDQKLKFDTEMTVALNGTTQLLGVLANQPVMMLIKNISTGSTFFADNPGSTAGTTMVAGEEIILDCRTNNGVAHNMGFPIGTPFYATGSSGTFKVSILYAY